MNNSITLDTLNYVLVLMAFGSVGSCYQAYKKKGSARPFWARIVTGSFAGSVTMLFIHLVLPVDNTPILHFGIATLIGVVAEKGEESLIDNILKKFIGGK